ncbi:MAG: hypothetical protein IK042_05200 [Bacteroidales bacterium]|nr:hypothetical protein [Bacteroidales bacterium]
MKKILFLLAPFLITACSTGDIITDKAVRLVKSHYRDCETILMVDVDTVTLGHNLDYRIEYVKRHVHEQEEEVARLKKEIAYYKKLGGWASFVKMYQSDLARADSTLQLERDFLHGLDSLKQATLDIADTPTAYQVCVAYNFPSNLVWIQLDESARLLKISKNNMDMLLNPGQDMPGYLKLLDKRYGWTK